MIQVKYIIPTKEGEPVHKRIFKVNGVRKGANKEVIADLGKTVEEYFKEQYDVTLVSQLATGVGWVQAQDCVCANGVLPDGEAANAQEEKVG